MFLPLRILCSSSFLWFCRYIYLRFLERPKSLTVSRIKSPLTLVSKGESQVKLGLWLTSSRKGLQVWSNMTSNPRI